MAKARVVCVLPSGVRPMIVISPPRSCIKTKYRKLRLAVIRKYLNKHIDNRVFLLEGASDIDVMADKEGSLIFYNLHTGSNICRPLFKFATLVASECLHG